MSEPTIRITPSLPGNIEEFGSPYTYRGEMLTIDDFEVRSTEGLDADELLRLNTDTPATKLYTDDDIGFGQRIGSLHGVNTCVMAAARTTDVLMARSTGSLPQFLGATEPHMMSHYGIEPTEREGFLTLTHFTELMRMAGYSALSSRAETGIVPDVRSLHRILASGGVGLTVQEGYHLQVVGAASLARSSLSGVLLRKPKPIHYQVWDPLVAGAHGSEVRYRGLDMSAEDMTDLMRRSGTLVGIWARKAVLRFVEE